MAIIEGISIKNYRALRDITLGRVAWNAPNKLTPLTVVIGKNGVGKSSIFDAFGFLADCMTTDIETACNAKNRGGFDKIVSSGINEPISFKIYYREGINTRPITYEVKIGKDEDSKDERPVVISEQLRQGKQTKKPGRPLLFLNLEMGEGDVWVGDKSLEGDDFSKKQIKLSPHTLGIVTLAEHIAENPRIGQFKSFIKNWYLSYFTPDAARQISQYGVEQRINLRGDNIANVARYLERNHRDKFQKILQDISQRIPGIGKIEVHREDTTNNVFLFFTDKGFSKPFTQQQMSDGTLKLFCYMLLLRSPDPAPFICIEEPENGLYYDLLPFLVKEFKTYDETKEDVSQVFVTTHQPYLVDEFDPNEVWVLEKNKKNGFAKITRADYFPHIKKMNDQGLPLGSLWYSGHMDEGE